MAFGFTATAGTITGTHSGFVGLFVTANFPAGSLSGANAILNGGGNLRAYTDSTKSTALPLEIVTLVTGASSEAQVRVRLNSLSTSGTVYFEADDTETTQPAVTAPLGRDAVWSDYDYKNHMDGTGLLDSTGAGDGSFESGTPTQVSGKIGDARDFVSEGLNLNRSMNYTGGEFQLSGWLRWDGGASGGEGTVFDQYAGGVGIVLRYEPGSGGRFEALIGSPLAVRNFSGSSISDNQFHKVDMRLTGGELSLFVDGSQTPDVYTSVSSPTSNALNTKIARANSNAGQTDWFIGVMDEMGIVSPKSDNYILTEYDNQNSPSTFWTSSAWEDQGGGVIDVSATLGTINYQSNGVVVSVTGDIDVISTLGTIDYLSQNAVVQLSGEISVISTLGTINYLSQDVDVSVTGDIDVITTLGTINYQSNNTIVNVSGDILVQATLGTIDYLSQNAVVSITGDIDVISTLGTISYASQDTTVSLVGGVNVPATLGTISYQSNDALVEVSGLVDVNVTLGSIFYDSNSTIVKLSEGQDIGNVTVSFQDDIYTAGFKPDTITVNFK